MCVEASRQEIVDREQLRLLSIGYYVAGALHIGFASLFIFHFVFLSMFALHPEFFPSKGPASLPPTGLFEILRWVLGAFILLGWTFGALTILAGRYIKARKRRTFSFIIGILNGVAMPFGTILAVCVCIVLSRTSVQAIFERR